MATNRLRGIAVLAAVVLVGSGFPASAEVCEGYEGAHLVRSLGGPNALFSSGASSVQELSDLFAKNEADLRKILAAQGIEGITEDLLAVLASGAVEETSLEPGQLMTWMGWRGSRSRQAKVAEGLCYGGTKPYPAFSFEVEHDGWVYPFLVPKVCANIALAAPPRMAKAPAACAIRVSCDTAVFTVDATGSSAGAVVTMGPMGGAPMTVKSADDAGTVFEREVRDRDQTYAFTVSVDDDRYLTTCTETVEAATCPPPPPSCSFLPNPIETVAGETVVIEAQGSWSSFSVELLDDTGATVTEPMLGSTFPQEVVFPEHGVYTIRGTAKNQIDETAVCEASADVARASWWTARFFPLSMSTDDVSHQTLDRAGTEERRRSQVNSGFGAGAALEYHMNERIGFELGLLYAQADEEFMIDFDDVWDMGDDDLSVFTAALGANFHLTPDAPVDLYVGPMIGYVDFGSTEFPVEGGTVRQSFDSELTWGLQLGLDVPFGDSAWGFHAGVRYFDADAEDGSAGGADDGPETLELAVDPIFLGFGLKVDF